MINLEQAYICGKSTCEKLIVCLYILANPGLFTVFEFKTL